jgi:hypothetical protein
MMVNQEIPAACCWRIKPTVAAAARHQEEKLKKVIEIARIF